MSVELRHERSLHIMQNDPMRMSKIPLTHDRFCKGSVNSLLVGLFATHDLTCQKQGNPADLLVAVSLLCGNIMLCFLEIAISATYG